MLHGNTTIFLGYMSSDTLPILFPQEIFLTDLLYILFLLLPSSLFSSACLRCNSNFKCLLYLRFDFVFKYLKKKIL